MSKLNIEGYKKIIGLAVGDWQCMSASESDEIYTFIFNLDTPGDAEQPDIFNLVTIYRNYEFIDGFKIEVDFHINTEIFPKVKTKFIYAHNIITMNKFKEVLLPLLVITP